MPARLLCNLYAPVEELLRNSARILVVDDDDGIRGLMTAIFQPAKVEVEFAGDGETALFLIRREHFDAIVLDLMLPKINGFEVIRELKAIKPSMLERTVVLTAAGHRTLQDFEDGRLVQRVILKPFDLEAFVTTVLECCSMSRARAASAAS
jgi:CheY-like chemotaxis protein